MFELEDFFLRSWNWSSSSGPASSTVLVTLNLVMNVIEIKRHVLNNLSSMTSGNHSSIHVLKYVKWIIEWWKIPTSSTNEYILFHFKVYHRDWQLTLAIVDFNVGICNLIIIENILREVNLNINASFITAAPRGQGCRLTVYFVLLECNWRLMDHEEILVSDEGSVMIVDFCHDRISYLNFRFSIIVLFLPVATSWCPVRKSELKWDCIVSRIKRLVESEAILFEFKEFLSKLNLDTFRIGIPKPIISFNLIPMTSLLLGFYINFQKVGLHLSGASDVDFPINSVASIVECFVSFDEEISSIKLTSRIEIVSHS